MWTWPCAQSTGSMVSSCALQVFNARNNITRLNATHQLSQEQIWTFGHGPVPGSTRFAAPSATQHRPASFLPWPNEVSSFLCGTDFTSAFDASPCALRLPASCVPHDVGCSSDWSSLLHASASCPKAAVAAARPLPAVVLSPPAAARARHSDPASGFSPGVAGKKPPNCHQHWHGLCLNLCR